MRHKKRNFHVGADSEHRRALIANMLKALITHERIETTLCKAKELRRHADRMITLSKRNTLATRRKAISEMMITFNALTSKEARAVKNGDSSSYNDDRRVISKLFDELGTRFANRKGGYTRILKKGRRTGDQAQMCYIEYLSE